ncbi:MAG: DUF2807 domain-containing protein [Flavobacteriales bacterium]|nr:DUF2807 domain-containing protein [Flavobacteriales bacterium]MBK6944478.1 DUF2807 domain-containing protein [Flavobacteriales bacterium]MBK7241361.1 DUF2807 domain-containing protein [Flavobacteriales bacterium]MBK9534145.1 DUF2807 domain-containing protein [Flavobacteriales bacterium]HQV53713.1 head GIN domain-containing protein [Flavobacteriales bacterium]
MTQQDRTEKALELLRDLPAEVSVEDVSQMVTLFPLIQPTTSWFSHINLNSILMTSVSALIIAGAAYFFTGIGEPLRTAVQEQQPVVHEVPMIEPTAEVLLDVPPSEPTKAVVMLKSNAEVPQEPLPAPVRIPIAPTIPVVPTPAPEKPLAIEPTAPPPPPPAPSSKKATSTRTETKTYDLKGFTAVNVFGPLEVYIAQAPYTVSAQGTAEELENIEMIVKGNVLEIRYKEKNYKIVRNYKNEEPHGIHITLPDLERVQLNGSGDIYIDDLKGMKMFEMELKGSGDIHFASLLGLEKLSVALAGSGDIQGEEVEVSGSMSIALAGSGDVMFGGRAENVEVSVVGSGDVNLEQLTTSTANVTITGSGDVSVNCKGTLTTTVMGSGEVHTIGSGGSGPHTD